MKNWSWLDGVSLGDFARVLEEIAVIIAAVWRTRRKFLQSNLKDRKQRKPVNVPLSEQFLKNNLRHVHGEQWRYVGST